MSLDGACPQGQAGVLQLAVVEAGMHTARPGHLGRQHHCHMAAVLDHALISERFAGATHSSCEAAQDGSCKHAAKGTAFCNYNDMQARSTIRPDPQELDADVAVCRHTTGLNGMVMRGWCCEGCDCDEC